MVFGRPPDTELLPPGPEDARKLQDQLDTAHDFARVQLLAAGCHQKRNYDTRVKGRPFRAGELFWVFQPQRRRGRCPKLDSAWMGPCWVLEPLGEVIYRVQILRGVQRVELHHYRLAPHMYIYFVTADATHFS